MSRTVDRRQFLHSGVSVPLGVAALAAGSPQVVVAQPEGRRVGGAKLKTSLNAFSFSKMLNDHLQGRGPGISLLELLEFCARHGFDALDPTGYFFPGYPKPPEDAYVNEFKRRAFQLGVEISGTGIRNDFATPDASKRAEGVQHAKEWIEAAAKMGAPVIRVFAGEGPAEGYSRQQVAAWMVEALQECVEHGKQFGVIVGVQNHGDFLQTADQVLEIVRMVDSEWFGVIVDTGFFMTDDPYDDIARVLPYAVNWQIKETLKGKESGIKTDLKRIVTILRDGGYRGYIPIETLSLADRPYDPLTLVPGFLKELEDALAS